MGPSFQGVNRLFVLAFNGNASRTGHWRYYLPTAKVQDFNVVIYRKLFFDQPIKNCVKKNLKNYNCSRR